jgi:hypothetical protein
MIYWLVQILYGLSLTLTQTLSCNCKTAIEMYCGTTQLRTQRAQPLGLAGA